MLVLGVAATAVPLDRTKHCTLGSADLIYRNAP